MFYKALRHKEVKVSSTYHYSGGASLCTWRLTPDQELIADPAQVLLGNGQMKPEQLEAERLRREVAKLKSERDMLKKPSRQVPSHTFRRHENVGTIVVLILLVTPTGIEPDFGDTTGDRRGNKPLFFNSQLALDYPPLP